MCHSEHSSTVHPPKPRVSTDGRMPISAESSCETSLPISWDVPQKEMEVFER